MTFTETPLNNFFNQTLSIIKASDTFKTTIENYLNETALSNTVFAQNLAKTGKNIESCFNYIFGEVKKTGLCAFDNQEIFDMAVKYYNDDSIAPPASINCKAVVNQPVKADLFTLHLQFLRRLSDPKLRYYRPRNPYRKP